MSTEISWISWWASCSEYRDGWRVHTVEYHILLWKHTGQVYRQKLFSVTVQQKLLNRSIRNFTQVISFQDHVICQFQRGSDIKHSHLGMWVNNSLNKMFHFWNFFFFSGVRTADAFRLQLAVAEASHFYDQDIGQSLLTSDDSAKHTWLNLKHFLSVINFKEERHLLTVRKYGRAFQHVIPISSYKCAMIIRRYSFCLLFVWFLKPIAYRSTEKTQVNNHREAWICTGLWITAWVRVTWMWTDTVIINTHGNHCSDADVSPNFFCSLAREWSRRH